MFLYRSIINKIDFAWKYIKKNQEYIILYLDKTGKNESSNDNDTA